MIKENTRDVILNSKKEISTDVQYKDTNTYDYLIHDSAHPESCKKSIPYNLAKKLLFYI